MKLLFARWRTSFTMTFVLLCLQACGEVTKPAGLVYCSEGNPESFNPQLVTSGTAIDATSKQLYNRLIGYDVESGNIAPELATSWTVSDDGLSYHFFLRKNVKFHSSVVFTPSRDFDANDVIFSFERITKATHPYFNVSKTGYPYFESIGFSELINRIERVNDHEIIFHLNKANSSFLANLATDFSIILSAEYAQQALKNGTPELIDQQPIGTGPFRLTEYVKNKYLRFHRFNGYWDKIPEIDQLVFDVTPKSSLRMIKLITGDCNMSALPNTGELSIIKDRTDLRLESKSGFNVAFLALNTLKPPFDNANVRKALSLAIDRQNILMAVYGDTGLEARSILPPASWAYNKNKQNPEYNPTQARLLLDQAGVKNLTMTIWTGTVARPYNPNPHKTAELIQSDFAKIGVNTQIISVEWSIFNQKLNQSDYDAALIGWSADNSDPDNFFTPLLSCISMNSESNRSKWCDPYFENLINQAKQSNSKQERISLYHQAETHISDQMPLITLAHAQRQFLQRSNIKTPKLAPFGALAFGDIQIISPKDDH